MADKICTRFIDNDGFDVGCKLVTKEYVLEAYPDLVPWMKVPALWAWGSGNIGQLGNNAVINRSSPVQTVSGGTNWKNVAASSTIAGDISAAIKTDGTLWLWGTGADGRLGNQSVINISSPVQTISGGTNWQSVSVSGSVNAIKTDGTLWLWGCNVSGELGDQTVVPKSSPVQTISAGTNWKRARIIGAGVTAIKTDGTLWLWGSGSFGRLGNQSVVNRSSPVQTISAGTNWKTASGAGSHTGAIKTDGTLWLWGSADSGQLGNDSLVDRSSPVQTISAGTDWKQISVGGSRSVAIKTNGTLWFWGSGTAGIRGDLISRSSPIQTVSGGTNWFEVNLSNTTGSSISAIKTDGTLWLWGDGSNGVFGTDSPSVFRSSPVQTISGGTGWRDVSQGANHVLAIRDEGEF